MFKNRVRWIVGVLLFSLLAGSSGPVQAQVVRGARESALTSAVQVRVKTKWGSTRRCSGYLFSSQGIIITTFAAVSDAVSIDIYQADLGVLSVSRIRRLDERANLAVLMVAEQLPGGTPVAQLGESKTVASGDKVFVLHHVERSPDLIYETTVKGLGYPQQLPPSDFTKGYAQEILLFQLDGGFDAGSAGAIVCNESWNVIGMLVGSTPAGDGQRTAYAVPSAYLPPLANSSYDAKWSQLATGKSADAEYFDRFFGPARKERKFQAPMSGGYVAWFAPMYPASYRDPDFTTEINDKVKKSWFASYELKIDSKPLREVSGSQVVVWSATTNPWGVEDGTDRYVNFDADSLFSKRVYKNRTTEERIMTRHILAIELAPGSHVLQYENRGANFKSTGVKRRSVAVASGTVQLLDIQGLSLVQMDRLPPPAAGIGEKNPVKYELTRRPLSDQELIYGIRSGWFER